MTKDGLNTMTVGCLDSLIVDGGHMLYANCRLHA